MVEALQQQGWSVWWDPKIKAGKVFRKVIREALDNARCVVVVWSLDSVESNWVTSEADVGLRRKVLVPILLDEVTIPLGFEQIQAASLVGWPGTLPSAEFDELVEAISEVLSSSPGGTPDASTQPTTAATAAPQQASPIAPPAPEVKRGSALVVGEAARAQAPGEDRQAREIYLQIAERAPTDRAEAKRIFDDFQSRMFQIAPEQSVSAKEAPAQREGAEADDEAASGASGILRLRDAASGREMATLEGHYGAVWSVAVSADGKVALSASDDETLKLWNLETEREPLTLKGHMSAVRGVAMDLSGRVLSGALNGGLAVWGDSGIRYKMRRLPGHERQINGVALSADGRVAASASDDRTVKLWDVESGSELRTLQGHTGPVLGVAMSADGQLAISASEDKTLRVWKVESGRELHVLVGHTGVVRGVAISADGKIAASASGDRTVKVWDLQTATELRTMRGHTSFIRGVGISSDGRLIVSASGDKTLRLWEFGSGRQLAVFNANTALRCCAISADGKTLVAGGGHSIAYIRLE